MFEVKTLDRQACVTEQIFLGKDPSVEGVLKVARLFHFNLSTHYSGIIKKKGEYRTESTFVQRFRSKSETGIYFIGIWEKLMQTRGSFLYFIRV